MLITGVLCLAAAIASLVFGLRTLTRPRTGDPVQLVQRAVAPTQLAAGGLLAVGGAVALLGSPQVALMVLIICVTGALGTLTAGAWQGARYAARHPVDADYPVSAGCGAGCGCAAGSDAPAPPDPSPGCGCGCACS